MYVYVYITCCAGLPLAPEQDLFCPWVPTPLLVAGGRAPGSEHMVRRSERLSRTGSVWNVGET